MPKILVVNNTVINLINFNIIFSEEINASDKSAQIIPSSYSFGTLKGLEHSVNPQLMKYSRETDALNTHARQEYRRRLFQVYPYLNQVIIL